MKYFWLFIVFFLITVIFIAIISKPGSIYKYEANEKNPMEGKKVVFVENKSELRNADGLCGHLEAIGDTYLKRRPYNNFVKRVIDIVLSLIGLVVLSPVFLMLSLAIVVDDPGPIFFTQKRVGLNKQYFKLHKFRSMKMSTPRNVPTHMLENPDQYITRIGRFIRKFSLDELPQIFDILIGNMSIIGPRPALWNQDLLIAERDKYGANDIRPGLTGWAQINGRDELEIPVKAKFDGAYVQKESLLFDFYCFVVTITSVLKSDGVTEGGTGIIKTKEKK